MAPASPARGFSNRKARRLSSASPAKPRRSLNAYNFFFMEQRQKLVEEREAQEPQERLHGSEMFSSMGKIISKRWKTLDSQEKQRFQEKATRDKERFKREMEVYNRKVLTERLRASGDHSRVSEIEAEARIACQFASNPVPSSSQTDHDNIMRQSEAEAVKALRSNVLNERTQRLREDDLRRQQLEAVTAVHLQPAAQHQRPVFETQLQFTTQQILDLLQGSAVASSLLSMPAQALAPPIPARPASSSMTVAAGNSSIDSQHATQTLAQYLAQHPTLGSMVVPQLHASSETASVGSSLVHGAQQPVMEGQVNGTSNAVSRQDIVQQLHLLEQYLKTRDQP